MGKRIGTLTVKHVHVFIMSVVANLWAEFVGSLLCSKWFSFPLSSKTNFI